MTFLYTCLIIVSYNLFILHILKKTFIQSFFLDKQFRYHPILSSVSQGFQGINLEIQGFPG